MRLDSKETIRKTFLLIKKETAPEIEILISLLANV